MSGWKKHIMKKCLQKNPKYDLKNISERHAVKYAYN